MHQGIEEGERVIYGVLDWFGDIGGFFDAVKYIAVGLLLILQF